MSSGSRVAVTHVARDAQLALFAGASFAVIAPAALVAFGVSLPWALAVGLACAAVAAGSVARPRLRRFLVDREPFPEAWRTMLERRVSFYGRLDTEDRARFERELRYFVREHVITGPQGEPVDDEALVLTGASAAILAFGRPGYRWPRVRDVIVYPDAFDEDYEVSARGRILGQVGRQGPIILSAKALREGFQRSADGLNVGLHELAHVLDLEDGHADGVPSLMPWSAIQPWVGVMQEEVSRARKRKSLLRRYAGTNEAELFAVATEAFFERPQALERRHPELYELMCITYGQDPAEMGPATRSRPSRSERNERKRRRRERREKHGS